MRARGDDARVSDGSNRGSYPFHIDSTKYVNAFESAAIVGMAAI